MKKITYFALSLLLVGLNVHAKKLLAPGGIWYELDEVAKTAVVIPDQNEPPYIIEDVTIFGVINDEGEDYTVIGIADEAFKKSEALRTITLPNTLRLIGNDAFARCSNLEAIELPDGLEDIGASAFMGCTSLLTVNIPASVNNIDANPWSRCSSLIEINVDEANANYKSEDGVLFTKNGQYLMVYPIGSIQTEYAIPDGVLYIEESAFFQAANLASVEFPASLEGLYAGAFEKSGVISAVFNEGLRYLADRAFQTCENLTIVDLPSSLTSLGNYVFRDAENLTSIACRATEVPSLGDLVFSGVPADAIVYVPDASIEKYEAALQWNDFAIQSLDIFERKQVLKSFIDDMSAMIDFAYACKVPDEYLKDFTDQWVAALQVYNNTVASIEEINIAINDAELAIDAAKEALLTKGKDALKAELDKFLQEEDHETCVEVIETYKGYVDALAWDDSKSVRSNMENLTTEVNNIFINALLSVKFQRLYDLYVDLDILYQYAYYNWYYGYFDIEDDDPIIAEIETATTAAQDAYNNAITESEIDAGITAANTAYHGFIDQLFPGLLGLLIDDLNTLLIEGDPDEVVQIVNAAKIEVLNYSWDFSLSFSDNFAALNDNFDNLYEATKTAVETERAKHVATDLAVSDVTENSAHITWNGPDGAQFNVEFQRAFISDFENGMKPWTEVDADKDGYTWEWGDAGNLKAHSGKGLLQSASYANSYGALTPDNWLVSPQITLGGIMTWWVIGQDASYAAENYGIAVSTTGTAPEDFTMILENLVASDTYENLSADLTSFSGKGYVAIRHYNITDMFVLNIDDVEITEPGEAGLKKQIGTPDKFVDLVDLAYDSWYSVRVQTDDGLWSSYATFKTTIATGAENVASDEVKTEKLLRDGQLYIMRDGKIYNVMGAEMK